MLRWWFQVAEPSIPIVLRFDRSLELPQMVTKIPWIGSFGVSYHTGLLPDCSKTQGAPCVQARHKDNAGDVVVEFLAAGDPVGRG